MIACKEFITSWPWLNCGWVEKLLFGFDRLLLPLLHQLNKSWGFICCWAARFFPNNISFGVFGHSKGVGAKWHVCLLGFFGFWGKWLLIQNRFCAEKGGPRFSTFFSQAAVASEKAFWEVLPTALISVSQSPFGAKATWNLDIFHPYPSTLQKTIHRIITVGGKMHTRPLLTNFILPKKHNEIHKNPRLNWKMFEQRVRPLNLLHPPAVPTEYSLAGYSNLLVNTV